MRIIGLLVLGLLLIGHVMGQPLNGVWNGSMAVVNSPSLTPKSTVTLRVAGSALTGELIIQINNTTDKYILKGTINGQQAQGTATYPIDGTVFQFEAALQNHQLLFAVGQNGAALMSGRLNRSETNVAAAAPTNPPATAKPDGLYRDPNLIGTWRTDSNYGGGVTDGGFYGSTSSTMILRSDGTFGDGGSSGYASGSGVSVTSSGAGNSQLYKQLEAAGARWFTKGNLFYVRLTVNGQQQDVASAKYYVENGKALLTDLKNGKKTLYYKVK